MSSGVVDLAVYGWLDEVEWRPLGEVQALTQLTAAELRDVVASLVAAGLVTRLDDDSTQRTYVRRSSAAEYVLAGGR